MAASTVVKNFTDGTLTLKDGTGTPLSLVLPFDLGTIAVSGLKAALRETAAYEAKGARVSLRKTTRVYPTGSFTAHMAEFTDVTTGSILDLIAGTAGTPFASRVSTTAAIGDLMTFDAHIDVEGTDFSDVGDHNLVLEDCELSVDFASGDPNSYSISFTVYGAISGDISLTE